MTRSQRTVALLLLASLNAFGFIDRVVIGLVAQQVKAEFLLSDLQIGLLGGTVFALVNTFAAVPVAMLAERYKRSHVAAIFLLIGSAFTMVAGFTISFFQLMICRLGMACGSAATEAPPHSMISDMYPPEKRASAISLFMLGVPIAALLGSFAGGAIAESFGWQGTFLAFGLGGVAISLLCFAFLKEPERKASPETGRAGTWAVARMMITSPTIIFITIGASFVSLGSFGVNTFLPAFFSRDFALGAGEAGLLFGLVSGIASFTGTLAGGYGAEWAAKHDRRWLLAFPALSLVIGVPVFLIGLNSGSLMIGVPLMVIGCFSFYMAMGPCIATLHGSLDSFSRATGSALFLMVMHLIGQGLGPPLIGLISDIISAGLYQGNFAADCAGAAGQVPGSTCAQALATGLRYSISTSTIFHGFAALFLYLGARAGHRAGIAARLATH